MHEPAVVDGATPPLDEAEKIRRRLVRLALDVHDGPMQNIAAVAIRLRELEGALDGDVRDQVGELLGELGDAETGLRRLLQMLGSNRPAIRTVEEIVREGVERFRQRSTAAVTIEGELLFQPDTESQAIAIEALVRESLANVAKHAHAGAVQIRIEQSASGILVEIEDDGIGFEPARVRSSALGLAGMRERLRMLDGEFEILTRPGGPTVVTALLRRWQLAPAPSPELPAQLEDETPAGVVLLVAG